MIDLRNFIRLCLEDVVGAVADAQRCDTLPKRTLINPRVAALGRKLDQTAIHGGDWVAQMVEFDVAVTAQREAGGEPKIGVAGVVGDASMNPLARDLTTISRIRFAVPVVLPEMDV